MNKVPAKDNKFLFVPLLQWELTNINIVVKVLVACGIVIFMNEHEGGNHIYKLRYKLK